MPSCVRDNHKKDYDMSIENKSLSVIAIEVPGAAAILRKSNLDYCCGGKKSLKDACNEQRIDLDSITREIFAGKEAKRIPFENLSPKGITTFIVERYHQDLRQRLPELLQLAVKVEKVHADSKDLPRGLGDLLKELTSEMFTHMDKEEQILFPLIKGGQSDFVKGPIAQMEFEHEHHGDNLRKLKDMTNNFQPPGDACTTWKVLYKGLEELEAELMDHINLENNVLFPRALNALVP